MLLFAALSATLYYKIVRTFQSSRQQTARSKTLTRAFIALWVSWILMVLPSQIFNVYLTHYKSLFAELYIHREYSKNYQVLGILLK